MFMANNKCSKEKQSNKTQRFAEPHCLYKHSQATVHVYNHTCSLVCLLARLLGIRQARPKYRQSEFSKEKRKEHTHGAALKRFAVHEFTITITVFGCANE